MSRKSVGLALVLAGGLSAWTLPAAFAQIAPDVPSPIVGDVTSEPSAPAPALRTGGASVQPLAVPYYPQFGTQWCWATSISMLLRYYGFHREPWQIAADFDRGPEVGLHPNELIVGDLLCPLDPFCLLLECYTLECYLDDTYFQGTQDAWIGRNYQPEQFGALRADLQSALIAGHPVWLGSAAVDHDVVVTGFDDTNVYINDPSGALVGVPICGDCSDPSHECDCVGRPMAWSNFLSVLHDWLLFYPDVFTITADPSRLTPIQSSATVTLRPGVAALPGGPVYWSPEDSKLWFGNFIAGSSRRLGLVWDGGAPYAGYRYLPDANGQGFYQADNDGLFDNYGFHASHADTLSACPSYANHGSSQTELQLRTMMEIYEAGTGVQLRRVPSGTDPIPASTFVRTPANSCIQVPLYALDDGVYLLRIVLQDAQLGTEYDSMSFYFGLYGYTAPTIAGYIRRPDGGPLSGVFVTADSLGSDSSDFSGATGFYSLPVSYGWSGQVRATTDGYVFSPAYREYANITEDVTGQDFVGEHLATGACCAPGTLTCTEETESGCASSGGAYLGDGSSCLVSPENIDACDCNDNGVLDRDELPGHDCNTNGILDACDIASALSQDTNHNGVPDECDPAPPGVSNGKVIPSSGSDLTVFRFEVTYMDPTGRDPLQYNAGVFPVNGNWDYHGMRAGDGAVATGRVYYYETWLPQGSYAHRFHFETADHDHIYYPESVYGDPGPTVGVPDPLVVRFCAAEYSGAPPNCNPQPNLYQEGDVPSFYWDALTPDGNPCCDCLLQLNITPPNPYVTPVHKDGMPCGHYEYGTPAVPATNWQFGCGCYTFLAVATHPGHASGQKELKFETCPCPTVPPVEVDPLTISPGTIVPGVSSAQIRHCINLDARETIWIRDSSGIMVKTLLDNIQRPAGCYTDSWDGFKGSGETVPQGDYKVAIEAIHLEPMVPLNPFGLTGTGAGQLSVLRGMTYCGGELHVLTWNDSGVRIVAFDRTGTYIPPDWSLPYGTGSQQVSARAQDLTCDADGHFYILDHQPANRITVWDANTHNPLCEMGRGETRTGEATSAPIAYDRNAREVLIWAKDFDNVVDDRIIRYQQFDQVCGHEICQDDVTPGVNQYLIGNGLAVDGNGTTWASTAGGLFTVAECNAEAHKYNDNSNCQISIRYGRLLYSAPPGLIQRFDLRHNWLGQMCIQRGNLDPEEWYLSTPDQPELYAAGNQCEQGGDTRILRIQDFSTVLLREEPVRVALGLVSVSIPNGGEHWVAGTERSIRWASTGDVGNVTIRLYRGAAEAAGNSPIAVNEGNDGEYVWEIPEGLPCDPDYRIRIEETNDAAIADASDDPFMVSGAHGDGNCDGHRDLSDYEAMYPCLKHPGEPATGMCRAYDLEPRPDGDVDLADFAQLQNAFTGP